MALNLRQIFKRKRNLLWALAFIGVAALGKGTLPKMFENPSEKECVRIERVVENVYPAVSRIVQHREVKTYKEVEALHALLSRVRDDEDEAEMIGLEINDDQIQTCLFNLHKLLRQLDTVHQEQAILHNQQTLLQVRGTEPQEVRWSPNLYDILQQLAQKDAAELEQTTETLRALMPNFAFNVTHYELKKTKVLLDDLESRAQQYLGAALQHQDASDEKVMEEIEMLRDQLDAARRQVEALLEDFPLKSPPALPGELKEA